jgi:iron-sulfur cluster assembly protein CyaY
MTSETLSESDFERIADEALRALEQTLGDLDERLEVDLASGVLTLEFSDGTKYVVNSHRAARQIWMAAERAAWHFDYRASEARWMTTKSTEELWATIEGVLSRKLGRPVTLRSPTR